MPTTRVKVRGCPFAALALVLASAGCRSTMEALTYKHADEAPLAFAVGRPIRVDVETFNGKVAIVSDPELEHAVVTFTRRAFHGPKREKMAKASLDQIETTALVVPGDVGQVLEVRTGTFHAEPYFQAVDVKIEAPEIDGVRVRTNHGDVRLIDVAGAIDVVTDDGNVRLMTNRPLRREVTVINNSGTIDYRVRGESCAAFDCVAMRGQVTANVKYGTMTIHVGTANDRLVATFNDGENPVVLRSADGDIRIDVVEAPTDVGIKIIE